MIRGKTVTLCLPCRNEGGHLKEVMDRIPSCVDEIIVISNCSTDNTVEIARKLGQKVRVIEDNRNIGGIGYGFAHVRGLEAAKGDIVVGADGDATYPVEDIGHIVTHLLERHLDFISCNRYPLRAGTKIPLGLRFGVSLLNLEVRLLYRVKVQDILSGMWILRRSIISDLALTMGDWNLSPQIKINAATNRHIRFAEYSIAQHQRLGKSKQHYFRTGFSHARWILLNRLGFLVNTN